MGLHVWGARATRPHVAPRAKYAASRAAAVALVVGWHVRTVSTQVRGGGRLADLRAVGLPQVLRGVGEAGDEPAQLLVDGGVELDVIDVRVEAEGDALRDGGPVLRLLLGVAEEARRREHLPRLHRSDHEELGHPRRRHRRARVAQQHLHHVVVGAVRLGRARPRAGLGLVVLQEDVVPGGMWGGCGVRVEVRAGAPCPRRVPIVPLVVRPHRQLDHRAVGALVLVAEHRRDISPSPRLEPDLDLGRRTERWGTSTAPTHARDMKSVGLMWMLYSVPTMWRALLVIASSRSDSKVTSQPQSTDELESEGRFEVGLGAHLVGTSDHRRGLRRVQLEQLIRRGARGRRGRRGLGLGEMTGGRGGYGARGARRRRRRVKHAVYGFGGLDVLHACEDVDDVEDGQMDSSCCCGPAGLRHVEEEGAEAIDAPDRLWSSHAGSVESLLLGVRLLALERGGVEPPRLHLRRSVVRDRVGGVVAADSPH